MGLICSACYRRARLFNQFTMCIWESLIEGEPTAKSTTAIADFEQANYPTML